MVFYLCFHYFSSHYGRDVICLRIYDSYIILQRVLFLAICNFFCNLRILKITLSDNLKILNFMFVFILPIKDVFLFYFTKPSQYILFLLTFTIIQKINSTEFLTFNLFLMNMAVNDTGPLNT